MDSQKVSYKVIGTKMIGAYLAIALLDNSNNVVTIEHSSLLEKLYPRGSFLPCLRQIKGYKIEIKIDWEGIYRNFYEEECTYEFKISSIEEDETSYRKQLSLTDQYGLTHILKKPSKEDMMNNGRKINCYVESISAAGLELSSTTGGNQEAQASLAEQDALFDKLHEESKKAFSMFNKRAYRGVWKSVIDKYPDTAHFIYELLQNADDALATEVTILLDRKSLIFKHNGTVHFTVTDVEDESITPGHINSIVGIGDSTKGDEEATNKIGKFGIGFKSVFQYTDSPEVYDDYFKFRIENYIVPERITTDHPMRDTGETLFRIPFKNPDAAYKEISEKLKVLANCTLFLNNLQRIRWKNLQTKEHKHFSKKVTAAYVSKNDIILEKQEINDYDNTRHILMFSRMVDVGEESKHKIYLGYYTNHEGAINTKVRPKVHCFFPTSETFNTCMIVHAPFLLVDNRQQIKPSEEVNKRLVNELGKLAADSLSELRDLGIREGRIILNDNIKDIVCWDEYSNYSWTWRHIDNTLIQRNKIIEPCLEAIKNEPLLLGSNDKYYKATDIYQVTPQSLYELLTPSQIQFLRGADKAIGVLSPALNRLDFDNIEEEIGIQSYTTQTFAYDITPDFMAKQPMAWVNKLFFFLLNEVRGSWNPEERNPYFLNAPIIQTMQGEWVAPFLDGRINVYSSGDTVQYNVISKTMLASKPIMKFLNELGCKEPDLLDHIINHVLNKYRDSNEEYDEDEIVSDFSLTLKYYRDASTDSQKALIESARSSLWICCKNAKGEENAMLAEELYLDTPDLISYFTGKNDIYFFESKCYASVIRELGRGIINDFLRELGIMTLPKVFRRELNTKYKLSDTQRQQLAKYSSNREEKVIDYNIVGLQNAVKKAGSKADTQCLWRILSVSEIDRYCNGEYRYFFRTYYYASFDSTIIDTLKTGSWIYIKGRMKMPHEVSIEELMEEKYEIHYELCEILGIYKKSIDLAEAGASEEQIENEKIGGKAREMGLTIEDLMAFSAEKKKREKEERQKQKAQNNASDFLSQNKSDLQNTGDNSFVNTAKAGSSKASPSTKEERQAKRDKAHEKVMDDIARSEEMENLRESIADIPKYTKEWFEGLLQLEYKSDPIGQTKSSGKTISLSFGRVMPDHTSDRIYILKNPSGTIPMEIETIERLEVHFEFMDQDDMSVVFEVASVRDFTLRIKAKASDATKLQKIDWRKCTRATVNANNPTELMGKLITAFEGLDLEDGFNLKENLEDNISFVFGPPGTGKTTYLANKICSLIKEEIYCKILVLAPTNKACDVLTEKVASIASDPSWLGRFVATGSDYIENSDILCGRDSEIDEYDQCCLVSTIARLPYDGFQRPGGAPRLRDIDWNYVIIDEASMIPLAQIVYAIYQFSPYAKIIIAGDPLQIPPICKEEIWKDENIYTMVNLNRFNNPVTEPFQFDITSLTTQYRSVPAIGKIFSRYSYDNLLTHYRAAEDIKRVDIDDFELKPINFIQFRVDRFDNIYGPKKLSGSNVQIYSVLLITEICRFVSQKYRNDENLNIGIICPYVAESQMIERMIEQIEDIPENIKFSVGTIHGFQGDECDMVFVVFNPPKGMNTQPDNIMLNKKHIVNVAISRAKDYLFLLIPHKDTVGYENLREINTLGRIVINSCQGDYQFFTCDEIEKIIFGRARYLEDNTFVTSHQMANVYTEAGMKYEVRIDDNSVDVQISD